MKAIVAVNKNWAIGNKGELLYSLPTDMKFFRETTMGKTVIMGRKTLESFPNSKPLKNRRNIVISSTLKNGEGYFVYRSVNSVKLLEKSEEWDEFYLIGGGSIYSSLIDWCDEALVTFIDDFFEGDTYFPSLDTMENWEMAEESEVFEENGYRFTFRKYKNKNSKVDIK